MAHTLLIGAHAVCGLVALATGIALLYRPPTPGVLSPLFRVYLGTLWLMALFLVLVVALDWRTVPTRSQALYSVLLLLALYVAWRGWNALQHLRHPLEHWRAGYIDDVGFTVIALFDGFGIISALDLGAPIWLVLVIAALGVLAGRYGVQRAPARALGQRRRAACGRSRYAVGRGSAILVAAASGRLASCRGAVGEDAGCPTWMVKSLAAAS